jgi:AcrR family transcriptional regulator
MKNREIIIRRALRLFRKHGIKSMSVERLTRELKLSRRALYSLFGDKEGLLAACLDLNYREEIEEFNRIRQQGNDPIEVFILAGQRVIEREFSLSPNFYHDILYYYPDLRDKAIKLQDNFNRKQLTGLFEEGKQQGLFLEDTDEALSAEAVILLYEGLFRAGIQERFELTKIAFFQKAIHPYIRGICTALGLERLEQHLVKHQELKSL